jgi:hypothetical protein
MKKYDFNNKRVAADRYYNFFKREESEIETPVVKFHRLEGRRVYIRNGVRYFLKDGKFIAA